MAGKVPTYMVDPSAGVLTVAQFTSDQHNLMLAETTTILRVSSDASRNITGITDGFSGRTLMLQNVGLENIVLVHQSASSSSTNRFYLPDQENITIPPSASIQLIYDGTSNVWRSFGSGAATSGAAWPPVVATGTGSSQNIIVPETGLTENDLTVAVNGLLQTPLTDYTVSGNAVTITATTGGHVLVRKNLGMQGIGGYGDLAVSNNLSELTSTASTARTNLGLGNVENKSSATIRSELTLVNIQAALPVSNTTVLWTGSSDNFYISPYTLALSALPQTLTDASTITWNANAGYNAIVTLGGNRTLAAITNPIRGLTYSLEIIQDGTGSRTLTWNACYDFAAAGTPTLSTGAGKRDFAFMYCYDAATPKFRVSFSKAA